MPRADSLGVVDVIECVQSLFGIEGTLQGAEYKFVCVNPRHMDSRPSSSVNSESGYWHCLACGVGGDLAELGVLALHLSRNEVLDLMRPASVEGVVHVVRSKLSNLTAYTRIRRATPVLRGPYDAGPLTSLRSRGFEPDTLERWGVRFVGQETLTGHKGDFTIRSSVGIPINSAEHDTLAWCYRRTDSSPSWQPRYLYDSEVSHIWYGMEHHAHAEHVTIVEGALDAMWLDQWGMPALGLLGAGMSTGKRQQIHSKVKRLQRFKSITLLGDRDQAGLTWVSSIGNIMGTRMPIYIATYPRTSTAHDPQELSAEELQRMLSRAKPWAIWHRSSPLPGVRSKHSR